MHAFRNSLRQQQVINLASQLGLQFEAPRIVCHAVSLTGWPSACSFPSGRGGGTCDAQRRTATSKSDSHRVVAEPRVTVVAADRPPDINSKELAKGPAEMPFAAKAYYIGAARDGYSTLELC